MWLGEQPTGVPGKFFASLRLPRISVDSRRGYALFKPVQLGSKVFDFLLKILVLLRASVSVVRDGHQLDQYLIMLDERAHSTEGGLEWREPIGGLFRKIKEDLRAVDDSLPLCWEIPTVRELTRWKALNLLTSIRIGVAPIGP